MATFREVVYMVLDLLKERSDDAYYTEEHIIFLASKVRNALLKKEYGAARFVAVPSVSDENCQSISVDLVPANEINGCSAKWLKSTETVPSLLSGMPATVFTINDIVPTAVTYIAKERMPYVGYNKWLKSIVYCSRSSDGYLYLHSANPQFMFLERVIFRGVFSDAEEAATLECDLTGTLTKCDILDRKFPVEGALLSSCIEMTVQELLGSRYAPEDKINNAKDDFGQANTVPEKASTPTAKNE